MVKRRKRKTKRDNKGRFLRAIGKRKRKRRKQRKKVRSSSYRKRGKGSKRLLGLNVCLSKKRWRTKFCPCFMRRTDEAKEEVPSITKLTNYIHRKHSKFENFLLWFILLNVYAFVHLRCCANINVFCRLLWRD